MLGYRGTASKVPIAPLPQFPILRMKNVVLLGSTGSIGTSAIKVAEDLPDRIRLIGLAAGGNATLRKRARWRPCWEPRPASIPASQDW